MTYRKKCKTRTRRRRRSKGGESWFRKVFSQNKTQNKVPPPSPPPKQQIHNWNNGAEEIQQKYGLYGERPTGQYRVHAFDHDGMEGVRDSDVHYDNDIAKKNGTYDWTKKSKRVTEKKYKGQSRAPSRRAREYRSEYRKSRNSPEWEGNSMPKWVSDDIERGEYRMESK